MGDDGAMRSGRECRRARHETPVTKRPRRERLLRRIERVGSVSFPLPIELADKDVLILWAAIVISWSPATNENSATSAAKKPNASESLSLRFSAFFATSALDDTLGRSTIQHPTPHSPHDSVPNDSVNSPVRCGYSQFGRHLRFGRWVFTQRARRAQRTAEMNFKLSGQYSPNQRF